MADKENVVVVLFNPSFSCVDHVLDYISVFRNTHSQLHVLRDLEKKGAKEDDLLILELSLPQQLSTELLRYINNEYPTLNTLEFNHSKKTINNVAQPLLAKSFTEKLPLNNHSFYLN